MRRSRMAVAAGGVVLAVAAVADVLLMNAADHGREDALARKEATQAARALVPVLLSYDHTSLAADLERSRRTTTGDFRHDFDKLVTDVVRPTAASEHVTTKAEISGAGVVSATTRRVTVLVFVTQTSTSNLHQSPVVTGSRVKVVMARTAGHWLIAGLDPV